jgi:hypothetical protein
VAPNRETREGQPLLIVETEANGDSKSTNERDDSLVGLLGLSCWYKRFCSALVTLFRPVKNILFSLYTFSNPLSPIAQQGWAGSHAGSPVS